MSNRLFIVPLLAFALSLPAPIAQGEPNDKKEDISSETEAGADTDKNPDMNEKDSHKEANPQEPTTGTATSPVTGERAFLKLAEPRQKKKKKGSDRPYGSYWTSLYGGKKAEAESDEKTGQPVEPSFSPYYAAPVKPQRLQRPREPEELKLPPLTPPPLSEFVETDFARFASGSYASEYADKFVKIRCKFARLAPKGMRLKEFPAPGYVNLLVTGTSSTMFSLTVAVPSAKAGRVLGLESQKEIILYGRAVKLGLSGLTLLVEEIETK